MGIDGCEPLKILELLGLDLENCRKASIHFVIDDAVIVEAEYYVSVEDPEKLETEVRKYRLERIE